MKLPSHSHISYERSTLPRVLYNGIDGTSVMMLYIVAYIVSPQIQLGSLRNTTDLLFQ